MGVLFKINNFYIFHLVQIFFHQVCLEHYFE